MKYFADVIDDIRRDAEKINRKFNTHISNEFYKEVKKQSREWYALNKKRKNLYERTRQLSKNATVFKKYSGFEYEISFEPLFIERKARDKGIPGSYEDSRGGDVASKVLRWEEEGIGPFEEYGYDKGQGIWGTAVVNFIYDIDKYTAQIDVLSMNLHFPDIGRDLLNQLKEKTKKLFEKEYDKHF